MAKAIIKHPLRVIGAIGFTTAALTALPLIGIATSTGSAILALGFAGVALGKTAHHALNAIKHNKNGEYNKVS